MLSPTSELRASHATRHPRGARTAGVLVVLAAALGGTGCVTPEARPKAELVRSDDSWLHPATLEPYTGPVVATYPGSPEHVEQRARLHEGRYDGAVEWYYESGALSARQVYRDGVRHGPYEWYYPNGELYERGTYRNGLRDGPYEARWEDGSLVEHGTWRAGVLHGPRRWYVDGQLVERATYVDGRLVGLYERWSTRGSLEMAGILRDGSPCGTWRQMDARIVYPGCSVE